MIEITGISNEAWAAGIIEADGCIMFKANARAKHGRHARIRVVMADEDIINDLYRVFGVGCIRGPLARSYTNFHTVNPKPLYLWEVNTQDGVWKVLTLIRPYLHARRGAKADEVLEHLEKIK